MARKDISMTAAEAADFLTEGAKVLQVATLGLDGFPHLSSLWFVLDGGEIVFRSFTKSQKIVNLRRDPRLTVLVEEGTAYSELRGVMIKGRATLIDDPGYVIDLYVALAHRYPMVPGVDPADVSDDGVRHAFAGHAAKNTAVVVAAERTVSWDHTKLGGEY